MELCDQVLHKILRESWYLIKKLVATTRNLKSKIIVLLCVEGLKPFFFYPRSKQHAYKDTSKLKDIISSSYSSLCTCPHKFFNILREKTLLRCLNVCVVIALSWTWYLACDIYLTSSKMIRN